MAMVLFLISPDGSYTYQVKSEKEPNLSNKVNWTPSVDPSPLYRRSWMQDKSVLIRNRERSTFIGKVADFDKRGNVILEQAIIMWKENGRFRRTFQTDMLRINIEDIWVAQISHGFKGLRGVGEDERLDNTNNRWAGWCDHGREE